MARSWTSNNPDIESFTCELLSRRRLVLAFLLTSALDRSLPAEFLCSRELGPVVGWKFPNDWLMDLLRPIFLGTWLRFITELLFPAGICSASCLFIASSSSSSVSVRLTYPSCSHPFISASSSTAITRPSSVGIRPSKKKSNQLHHGKFWGNSCDWWVWCCLCNVTMHFFCVYKLLQSIHFNQLPRYARGGEHSYPYSVG